MSQKLAGFWGDKYMVDWRSFAIGFAFLALIMGAFTFVVIIPASMQADSVETAILYHVQEIANHLVTMIFLGAAIVTALLDIGDQLKRKA
jgi:tryptophan-rich sensory protein